MTDQQTSTAADPPADPPASSSSSSSDAGHHHPGLEAAVGRIEDTLKQLVPGGHAGAQQRTEQHLDRGSATAEQVRAELDKIHAEEAAAAAAQTAAQGDQAERRAVQERLARLEERPPAPPRSRRTALLGWGDGRA